MTFIGHLNLLSALAAAFPAAVAELGRSASSRAIRQSTPHPTMKTNHSKTTVLALAVTVLIPILAGAADASADSWRTNMAAFAKSVAAIAAQSEIPNQFQLTESIRSRIAPTREGRPLWVILKTSFGKELHGELLKAFDGKVSWQGKVTSAELDQKQKTCNIRVAFPVADGMPANCELNDASLSIPFGKLPAEKLPAVGTAFSFTAKFETAKKEDDWFDRVWVLYRPVGAASSKHTIGVSLTDVAPEGK
jgi:hypothetical protein